MRDIPAQVSDLLRLNSMDPNWVDLKTIINLFASQMRIGLYGGQSSVPVLPSYRSPVGTISKGQPVAVIAADETEIRAALVTLTESGVVIEERASFPAPGTDYPAPWEDYIYAAAELVEPVLSRTDLLCFCLPFPMEISQSHGDGTILRLPGNMRLTGWENKNICGSLTAEFSRRGISGKKIILLNGTAAIQMCGLVTHPGQSRYLGLTWGTGIDTSFSAPGSILLRVRGAGTGLMLYDTGAGGFTGVPFGAVDLIMDRDCPDPGQNLFTKMVSVSYLGNIYRLTMIKAVEMGLMTFGGGRDFLSLANLDASCVYDFLCAPQGDNLIAAFCKEPADREIALTVAKAVFDRAARLVCGSLSSVLLYTGAGRDVQKPACVMVSGTAFDNPLLSSLLTQYLEEFTAKVMGLHCTLYPEADAALIGGAAAALLNQD